MLCCVRLCVVPDLDSYTA